MSRIDVFTPTIRHDGIKLVAKCLVRQTFQDFRWIVVDHDYDPIWWNESIGWDKGYIYMPPKTQIPERKYKLWNTRNTAYPFMSAPLVVEIQDYHWFARDTLQRFWDVFQKFPCALVSAYYKIVSFEGYNKALEGDISDKDVEVIDITSRAQMLELGAEFCSHQIPYYGYEMNVSSIPLEVLRKYTPVDERMDNGYLVDTHAISIPAMLDGYEIAVGTKFQVYSFEHKLFEPRPENWQEEALKNQDFLMSLYGDRLQEWYAGKFGKPVS